MLKLKERYPASRSPNIGGADIFICTPYYQRCAECMHHENFHGLGWPNECAFEHCPCKGYVVSSITLILDGHEIDIVTGDVVQWRAHGKPYNHTGGTDGSL